MLLHPLLLHEVIYLYFISGCSKCLKHFGREYFGDKPDYSGFNLTDWIPRNGKDHKSQAFEISKANTKTEKTQMGSASGVRYSELFRLPYFDPILSHAIDTMHNLLLVTAKHAFVVWVDLNLISLQHIAKIDALMKEVSKCKEIGRSTKSMPTHKSMKAEEWKNWVLLFSLYCLKDILPKRDFNLWQIFVRACKFLLNTSISLGEVNDAHKLLTLYCSKFSEMYGKKSCTPNMHMHLHLKDCILNFGPLYACRTFSFERYNGKLGAYHTNNRALTITMMRKLIEGEKIFSSYKELNIEDLPCLSEFKLQDDTFTSSCIPLDEIKRKDKLSEDDVCRVLHTNVSVATLYALNEVEKAEIEYIKLTAV